MLIEKYRNAIPVSDETVRVKRPNGTEAWALLSLFHFVSIKEHLGLLTLVDISKQKQVENAKSEFVSLASHQLRTPIAGIKWSAELLQMDNPQNLTDRQRKYIDRLLLAAHRMALLVDDFLRVSRFELGTFQPEYVEVNLTDLIKDIILEHTERIQQKNLDIKTFFDGDIESIISDTNLLRMIITNLFSNAVKYTREGGTVHIGFGRKNDDLLISVADNGMGIPMEDQERVFGKLFRAGNAVRQVPDGTGLGLYIVKEAVSVLGGNISFTSVENISTTFEVVLPLQLSK
jgi:signal transduction histidine kinase